MVMHTFSGIAPLNLPQMIGRLINWLGLGCAWRKCCASCEKTDPACIQARASNSIVHHPPEVVLPDVMHLQFQFSGIVEPRNEVNGFCADSGSDAREELSFLRTPNLLICLLDYLARPIARQIELGGILDME